MTSGDFHPFVTTGPVEIDETLIGHEPDMEMGRGGVRHRVEIVMLAKRS
jgi:hypothetical protein